MPKRDFIDICRITRKDLLTIIDLAHFIKKRKMDGIHPLHNKTLISVFEKPSTRTRISFEVAIQQLGGHNVIITNKDSQIDKGETIEDTAKVLSRFSSILMARVYKHATVETLAKNASVPVINGLSDHSHPCQIIADLLTFEEKIGSIEGAKIAWIGDGNNVCRSWIHAAEKLNFTLAIASPKEFSIDKKTLFDAKDAKIETTQDPIDAAVDADCVVTDAWVSMGDADATYKRSILKNYCVDTALMKLAKSQAIFMHCLPAHRGREVCDKVIDGKQSVVFDEAENRVHAQKAILLWCLNTPPTF